VQLKVLPGSALPGTEGVAVLILGVEWSLNKEFKSLTLWFITNSGMRARRLLPRLHGR